MNITTAIVGIGHGLDENGNLGVLNFAVLASADSGEQFRLEVSQIGGSYPPPATPRTPITEPVVETVTGDDGEPHEVVTGEKIVGYSGGYTPEELATIAEGVAQQRGAHAAAASRLESENLKPFAYTPPAPHVPTDAERKQMMADAIDSRIKFIYNRFMAFRMEYELREAAANAFKSGGYAGEPDDLVKRFADNIGMSYSSATDLILSQSANLRNAIPSLGNLRMDKYLVLKAPTLSDAHVAYEATMSSIDVIDGSLA